MNVMNTLRFSCAAPQVKGLRISLKNKSGATVCSCIWAIAECVSFAQEVQTYVLIQGLTLYVLYKQRHWLPIQDCVPSLKMANSDSEPWPVSLFYSNNTGFAKQ